MAALYTVDELVKRFEDGFYQIDPFFAEFRTAGVALHTTTSGNGSCVLTYVVPSMPSGVSSFIPARLDIMASTGYWILAKAIDLGSLNISTNVFTDGAVMPTVTELGVSRQIGGALWLECDVQFNATPGTLVVTYKDQDGNGAEASPSVALGNTVTVRSGSMMPLASGDTGVTDITNMVRSAGTTPTGTIHAWGLIPIGQMHSLNGNSYSAQSLNLLGADFNPVRLAAGDTLKLLNMTALTTRAIFGSLMFVGDA